MHPDISAMVWFDIQASSSLGNLFQSQNALDSSSRNDSKGSLPLVSKNGLWIFIFQALTSDMLQDDGSTRGV